MHPAKEGFSALPFFDEFDLSTVDVLLISQYVDFPYIFLNMGLEQVQGDMAVGRVNSARPSQKTKPEDGSLSALTISAVSEAQDSLTQHALFLTF